MKVGLTGEAYILCRMRPARPQFSSATPWIWLGMVAVMVAVTILGLLGIGMAVWTGEIKNHWDKGRPLFFRDHPGVFIFQLSYAGFLTLAIGAIAVQMVRVWRRRKAQERLAYEQSLARLEAQSSPAGNVIAKILAVPFILLAVLFGFYGLVILYDVLFGK